MTSSLINDVKKLVQTYHEKNAQLSVPVVETDVKAVDNRKKGCDELFEHIKGMIPEKVKTYAGYGRNEARVFEFKFKDEIKFGNCFAKDLLTKGDVISRLQSYLDTEHSDVTGPAFFVYFTHIGMYQQEHSENKFGVFINWDKESWEGIKSRLIAKPIRGRPRDEMSRGEFRGRGRGRGRGGFSERGRGGFSDRGRGRGNVTRDENSTPTETHVVKDELPEKHDE